MLESMPFEMHLDWPNLTAGAIVGFLVGFLANHAYWSYRRSSTSRTLRKKYAFLARTYSNWRNGTEPTTGSVKIDQNPDGSFKVVGRHADGSVDWKSVLHMSPDDENLGTG